MQPKHTSSEQITKPNLSIGRHPIVVQHPPDAPSSSTLSSQALATPHAYRRTCTSSVDTWLVCIRSKSGIMFSGRRLAGMYSKHKWDHVSGRRLPGMYSKQKWDLFSGRRLAGSKSGILLAVADEFSTSGILPKSFAMHLGAGAGCKS